jgi:hypothetical protein
MEDNLVANPFSVRKDSIKRLLSEKCTITFANLHVYLKDLLKGGYVNFKDMIKLSVKDIKIVLYLLDPK